MVKRHAQVQNLPFGMHIPQSEEAEWRCPRQPHPTIRTNANGGKRATTGLKVRPRRRNAEAQQQADEWPRAFKLREHDSRAATC